MTYTKLTKAQAKALQGMATKDETRPAVLKGWALREGRIEVTNGKAMTITRPTFDGATLNSAQRFEELHLAAAANVYDAEKDDEKDRLVFSTGSGVINSAPIDGEMPDYASIIDETRQKQSDKTIWFDVKHLASMLALAKAYKCVHIVLTAQEGDNYERGCVRFVGIDDHGEQVFEVFQMPCTPLRGKGV